MLKPWIKSRAGKFSMTASVAGAMPEILLGTRPTKRLARSFNLVT